MQIVWFRIEIYLYLQGVQRKFQKDLMSLVGLGKAERTLLDNFKYDLSDLKRGLGLVLKREHSHPIS